MCMNATSCSSLFSEPSTKPTDKRSYARRYIEIFRSTDGEMRRSISQGDGGGSVDSGNSGGNTGGGYGNSGYGNNGGGGGGGGYQRSTPYDRNDRGDRGQRGGYSSAAGAGGMGNGKGSMLSKCHTDFIMDCPILCADDSAIVYERQQQLQQHRQQLWQLRQQRRRCWRLQQRRRWRWLLHRRQQL